MVSKKGQGIKDRPRGKCFYSTNSTSKNLAGLWFPGHIPLVFPGIGMCDGAPQETDLETLHSI